jgi:hypothetical protein
MAYLIVLALAASVAWSWGYARRERANQREWKDYQAHLASMRPRPRFPADRWGTSTKVLGYEHDVRG